MNSYKLIHQKGSGKIKVKVKDLSYWIGIYPPTVYRNEKSHITARLSNWTHRSKPLSVPLIINENWSH